MQAGGSRGRRGCQRSPLRAASASNSQGAKSSERIIVVSENFVIKIDPNKKYKVMEKEPFSVISGISIFNFQDSKVGKYQKY